MGPKGKGVWVMRSMRSCAKPISICACSCQPSGFFAPVFFLLLDHVDEPDKF